MLYFEIFCIYFLSFRRFTVGGCLRNMAVAVTFVFLALLQGIQGENS